MLLIFREYIVFEIFTCYVTPCRSSAVAFICKRSTCSQNWSILKLRVVRFVLNPAVMISLECSVSCTYISRSTALKFSPIYQELKVKWDNYWLIPSSWLMLKQKITDRKMKHVDQLNSQCSVTSKFTSCPPNNYQCILCPTPIETEAIVAFNSHVHTILYWSVGNGSLEGEKIRRVFFSSL